jgi:hypothetical protein
MTFFCKTQHGNPSSLHVAGVGKLWSTQFVANLEIHIVSKVTICKISFTLNYFKDHIKMI